MFKVQKKAEVFVEVKILKRTTQPDILFSLETVTNEKNNILSFKKWVLIILILFPS